MTAPLGLRGWLAVALVVLSLVLGWTTSHYRSKAAAFNQQLTVLQARVALQNQEAERKLAELTRERDAKQAELDAFHVSQEKKDAAAKAEIARLTTELEQRPIRVRVVSQPSTCGSGGGSPQGDSTAPSSPGPSDGTEAYGLLPEANHRRLVAVIAEAEAINAAYASCRARLFAQEEAPR